MEKQSKRVHAPGYGEATHRISSAVYRWFGIALSPPRHSALGTTHFGPVVEREHERATPSAQTADGTTRLPLPLRTAVSGTAASFCGPVSRSRPPPNLPAVKPTSLWTSRDDRRYLAPPPPDCQMLSRVHPASLPSVLCRRRRRRSAASTARADLPVLHWEEMYGVST